MHALKWFDAFVHGSFVWFSVVELFSFTSYLLIVLLVLTNCTY